VLWLLVLLIFLVTVLLIVTRRVHHTTAALMGAVLVSITLISFGVSGETMLAMVRLEPILVITAMTVVAEVIRGGGVFQFLAMHFVRLTRGNPVRLFILFCLLSAALSTVLLNSVVILIIGYLTILTCQALEIESHPFFLGEMLATGVGGAFTLIGTSSNIIIADYAGFNFAYYLFQFGWFALVMLSVTLVVLYLLVRRKFARLDPEALYRVMKFNPWMMVPNRRVFYAYTGLFVGLIVAFALYPQTYVVALAGMMVFMLASHADPRTSLRNIEWDIIFFIGGLFVLSGALELVGILQVLAQDILLVSGGHLILASVLMLWGTWLGALVIGASPMATTFAPLVVEMATVMGWTAGIRDPLFWGVGFGAALGGVATPFGLAPLVVSSMAKIKQGTKSRRNFFLTALTVNILQIGLCTLFILLVGHPV
jgi:Na+/H+ antiporter NhaD/arsenite permease-like protein